MKTEKELNSQEQEKQKGIFFLRMWLYVIKMKKLSKYDK